MRGTIEDSDEVWMLWLGFTLIFTVVLLIHMFKICSFLNKLAIGSR
jgi:hypothetical protein